MSAGNSTRLRGLKWLESATYLTVADRERVLQAVRDCRSAHPGQSVGVRCASYIGEPSPIAVVDYGPGRRIFAPVYKAPQS